MEADPGTFDVQRLRQYMGLGVTRFSMGVQVLPTLPSLLTLWMQNLLQRLSGS